MTALPGWLAASALDDDALAVLANRGLVRRAGKEADRLTLVAAGTDEVELAYAGTPPATVKLLPGGPKAARCGCPVAGVCVHIVAACVWARTASSTEPASPTEPSPAEPSPAEPVEVPDVLTEVLALTPEKVNRSAGIAAVRKVAAAGIAPTPTVVVPTPGTLRVSWPDAPEVIVVAGGGFAGMLVSGTHTEIEDRALRLEAVVRVFAAQGRHWSWPEQVGPDGSLQPGQREALRTIRASIEALISTGLARVGADELARLRAGAQRARLEALPLLGVLLTGAAGLVAALDARDDDSSERDLLTALARAWALATALDASPAPVPTELVGRQRGPGEAIELGVLMPLAVRWWQAPSGARGLTVTLWDSTHGNLETVSTGRAAGQDPTFNRSWHQPLLWGASPETICAGLFTLTGAERRDDGTLSPTTRSTLVPGPRFAEIGLDLDQLAEQLVPDRPGVASVGFGPARTQVRLIRPRRLFGIGHPELDEVSQQLVWPMVDRAGVRQRARMDAIGTEQYAIGAILDSDRHIQGVLLDASDRPLSVFVTEKGKAALISPSLTPLRRPVKRGWAARKPDREPKAFVDSREPQLPPLAALADAVLDVCEALAATGRPVLSARQRDSLTSRRDQANDLGLVSLAATLGALLSGPLSPAGLLQAGEVAGRVRGLAEEPHG